jgi:hypothetical protein
MPPSAHAHAHTPGHRRPEEAYAPGAALPGSQGTTAGRGTWWSEGAAGRHLRTTAGQAGTLPAGPGTPSPVPISLRLERLATQAQHYPDMACTTLAQHREVAMRERAFRRLTPPSAPGVDRVPWRLYQETLQTPRETFHEQLVNDPSCPPPVVRRLLPQSNGKLRPLGLPAVEDKRVAKAVTLLLEAIDAQAVYDFSHGFRPGRNPHQARQEVRQGLLGSRMG